MEEARQHSAVSRARWHILRDEAAVTVCRRLPVRFDVAAEADMPAPRRPVRLAQQVRQDMWRMLQDQRGFLPAVRVTAMGQGVTVRAGGEIAASGFPKARIEAQITDLLASPSHRARWLRYA